jgi:predicted SprT family Zn-dependent metalloprotease
MTFRRAGTAVLARTTTLTPSLPPRRSVERKGRKREDRALVGSIQSVIAGNSPSGALSRIVTRWCSQWSVPNLIGQITFAENNRLRSSVARWLVSQHRLEFGALFFSGNVNHREVLCHELAHAAVSLKYGRRARAHGAEWRELVRAAGFLPRSRLPRSHARRRVSAQPPSRSEFYEHRCPVCQSAWYARKPVKAWRCGACAQVGLPGRLDIRLSGRGRVDQ